jgi:histone acetyltransferase 1
VRVCVCVCVKMDSKRPLEQFVTEAKDAVLLKLVDREEDLEQDQLDSNVCHPEFTHQIFGESEKIFGFTAPKLRMLFTPGSMFTCMTFSFDRKAPDSTSVTVDNPVALVKEWLSPNWMASLDEFRKQLAAETSFEPPGTMIHQYRLEDGGKTRTFEIYLNSSREPAPGFAEYMGRMQVFLVWYIEAASYLDLEDSRWGVFLLFERVEDAGQTRFRSVGMLSACEYWAYPEHIRPRVSQALVLPWFQGKGHGARMLQACYDHYLPMRSVIDFPVEDPDEQFTRMRDFVDVRNCLRILEIKGYAEPYGPTFVKLVQEKLKLAKTQTRRVYEILQFHRLTDERSPEYRAFVLSVKQRLYQPFAKSKNVERR